MAAYGRGHPGWFAFSEPNDPPSAYITSAHSLYEKATICAWVCVFVLTKSIIFLTLTILAYCCYAVHLYEFRSMVFGENVPKGSNNRQERNVIFPRRLDWFTWKYSGTARCLARCIDYILVTTSSHITGPDSLSFNDVSWFVTRSLCITTRTVSSLTIGKLRSFNQFVWISISLLHLHA